MKKILIVDKSFAVGGIQTSLINMVKALKDVYEIDVLMFYNEGILKQHFLKDVKVIEPSYLIKLHGMGLDDAKKEGLFTYFMRFITGTVDKCVTNRFSIWLSLFFQKKLKGYDAVIAFHHEDSIKATVSGFYRFVIRKTDAPIKLGWIHYDPKYISFDDKKNMKYMKQMDKIICVSKGTEDNFLSFHPSLMGKTDSCYNFQDIERILALSKKKPDVIFSDNKFNCFSACRLTEQKAMPRAIEAFAPVLKEHADVVWYIAGDGPDRQKCECLIQSNNLESQIILLGALDNPFPYMKNCDLYIQPSIYEAAPMVYGEALICKVPILTTQNISSSEMVDEKYGYICENNKESLQNAFEQLLSDRSKIAFYKSNLLNFEYTNVLSYQKIDELLRE